VSAKTECKNGVKLISDCLWQKSNKIKIDPTILDKYSDVFETNLLSV